MSFPTEPCFVLECKGWSPDLLQHPSMVFMRAYEVAFSETKEMLNEPYTKWHMADFEYTDAAGETFVGEQAWQKHIELYGLFSDYFHEPCYGCISETADGYVCFGQAKIYGCFKVPGQKKVKDLAGKEWEFSVPGGFHMVYVRDPTGPHGLKLAKFKLFSNALPVISEAIKRGMVSTEIVIGS